MAARTKAQAAMEFMVTYGWVFIAGLVIVASLNYFGIMRIDRMLPDSCFLSNDLRCDAFNAKADGITFYIVNNLGFGIKVEDAYIESVEGTNYDCRSAFATEGFPDGLINNNQGFTLSLPADPLLCNLESGRIVKGDLVITYHIDNTGMEGPSGYQGTTPHTVRGPLKVGVA
ncbi:hypothetical protein J4460_07665 [Candidatus Woesearchaeota archaeon]|nr:MAG: hypothetical protein QS99_C0011G0012 [archaeon GW2011_AR4]MBS3130515.1 hypothetical protein [Candidatus Woesearchaeota archaeon]HIH37995.1 hypothetical protein [Candidatus Woesearchaeota archaeon]HIJ02964.1 hypothetical protein [Candidatus Woesearchaeota archaeon]